MNDKIRQEPGGTSVSVGVGVGRTEVSPVGVAGSMGVPVTTGIKVAVGVRVGI